MPIQITAAVLPGYGAPFQLQSLALIEPGDTGVLIKLVSTGICHTDIKVSKGYSKVPLPVVLGHEGAGIVEQIGSRVEGLEVGDHVVLSFPSCGYCPQCAAAHPAYCDHGQELSFSCRRPDGSTAFVCTEEPVWGDFFGQSSFATHAVVSSRNAIKVDKDLPLEKLGPLGCGFQTGAGAVLNVMKPLPGQSLAVFGAGNVGLSAVMAARIAGMDPVIAVDINATRLDLALESGATHVFNSNGENDLVAAILKLTGAAGVNFSLDTSNQPELVRQAFESLANRGTCIHSGGGGKDLCFPGSGLLHGRTITGVIQGDSVPWQFIPRLLDYYREGSFPFDRLLSFYSLNEINRAIEDMEHGRVVKPVLTMAEDGKQ